MKDGPQKTSVIGFYGFSNSGKTSLIFKLIRKLDAAGYSSAVIKRTDKALSSEPKEKDTSGYRAAGAKITSFSSLSETNFVLPEKITIHQTIDILLAISDVDLIFVEGAFEPEIQKIRLGGIPKRENTIYEYDGDFDSLYNLILKMI
ncbi:MAG: molybdopterin-guanine dinucleotide biosynthesis protein MobB [Pelolinea sp.]|nr:molybdopterin-guanine dinucleotide biosynthesis protein MobB [Pelolinea sp.]